MSKTLFYQTDFKPDYQLFQQKISQLSSQKNRIIKKQVNLEKLQHQLELIKEEIEDQGFEYDQSQIFLKYASIQEINNKKKTASDCCMHCGQEMKKTVQCEVCAEVYCKNCCWRKRVIPYAEHQDFRLCCEQCHQKYIRHFNNQQFYKEKGIYLAAIDELERKYQKAKAKYDKKQAQVNQYKQQKRMAKIKQGNLKKAVLDEQKRIKQLQQDFERAVKQKAIKIKQDEEKRKRQQEEDRERRQKQESARQLQDQRAMSQIQQDQRKLQQASRLREQQLARRQEQIRRQKQQLQREKKQLSESRLKQLQQAEKKKKQLEQAQKKKPEEKIDDTKPVIKFTEQIDIQESPIKLLNTQQVVSMEEIDFDSILNNQQQPKPKQQQKQDKPSDSKQTDRKPQQPQQPNLKQLLKQIKLTKKPQDKPQPENKDQKSSNNNKNQSSEKHQQHGQQQANPVPRLTMTQIKTMSMNDLLSMKIPMNPSATKQKKVRKSSHPQIKVEAQENSTTTQNQKMYQSLLEPSIPQQTFMLGLALPSSNYGNNYGTNYGGQPSEKSQQLRKSVHSVRQEEEESVNDKESHKKALLRRESLISSVNKASITNQKTPEYNDEENVQGEPQKCTCQIM